MCTLETTTAMNWHLGMFVSLSMFVAKHYGMNEVSCWHNLSKSKTQIDVNILQNKRLVLICLQLENSNHKGPMPWLLINITLSNLVRQCAFLYFTL